MLFCLETFNLSIVKLVFEVVFVGLSFVPWVLRVFFNC